MIIGSLLLLADANTLTDAKNIDTSTLFSQFILLSAPLALFLPWFYVNLSVYNPCGVMINLC